MSNLKAESLARCLGIPQQRAITWAAPLNAAMQKFGIDTPARQAAFLAQIGHESARLRHVRELWGPTPAQSRYEGRKDLGNSQKGDGFKYRGRSLIEQRNLSFLSSVFLIGLEYRMGQTVVIRFLHCDMLSVLIDLSIPSLFQAHFHRLCFYS